MSGKRDTKSKVPRKRLVKEEVEVEESEYRPSLLREGCVLFSFGAAAFILSALVSYIRSSHVQHSLPSSNFMGKLGYYTSQFFFEYFGYCSFAIVISLLLLARFVWRQHDEETQMPSSKIASSLFFSALLVVACAILLSSLFNYNGGGYIGTSIAAELFQLMNKSGTILFSLLLISISLGVIIDLRMFHYVKLMNFMFKGAKVAAHDTGTALKVGAKAGSACIRKIPGMMLGPNKLDDSEDDDDELPSRKRKKTSSKPKISRAKRAKKKQTWRMGEKEEEEDEEEEYVLDDEDLEEDEEDYEEDVEDEDYDEDDSEEEDEEYDEEDEEDEELEEDEEYEEDEDEEYEDEDEYEDDEDDEEDYDEDDEEEESEPPRILRGIKNASSQGSGKVAARIKKTRPDKEPEKIYASTRRGQRKYDNFEIPSRDLLVGVDTSAVEGPDDDELLQNSKRLEQALRNFKIGGKVVEVHPGPVVTLYQFEPAAGIKVQRIINLADDLALALKVESVRVYAPVPGKGTVGVEVPNAEREIVRLRDLIDCDEFQNKPHPLALALGKDTYGQSFISDLSKMPHLLIAGATGTGKSVCINSLLMSLLYKNTPKDLKLILIDPKMLELSIYEKISHLLSPVITNPKRARGVLYWAVEEMERRYSLMKDLGVRDLAMYNRMVSEGKSSYAPPEKKKKDELITLEEKDVVSTTAAEAMQREASNTEPTKPTVRNLETMPRIVVVVDELADLMLTVGREIEELLTRLAQKARAAGIHLILATQRPSVNVITGLIKANFPARISFKVTSKIDARTILDQSGAERLLGQGDMLFYSPAIGRVKRLHSPFVSDQEVHDVVSWIVTQGDPDYDPEIERVLKVMEESENSKSSMDGEIGDGYDPLYDQAVNLVLEKGQASTSMVQRVFRIGYNRAARILETMEKEGVVGPADGAKPRQVLSAPLQ